MTKTYRGSCHCGKFTFEADLDLSQGASKCNCSMCWKSRAWTMIIKPDAFRVLSGREELSEYSRHPAAHYMFCRHCGIRAYGWGNIPEVGGDFVSVSVATLDDLDPADLVAAPLRVCDGKNNAWWNPPAESRHL